jgi:hypothetical protein
MPPFFDAMAHWVGHHQERQYDEAGQMVEKTTRMPGGRLNVH